MNKFKSISLMALGGLLSLAMASCGGKEPIPTDPQVLEETYAGGELGTTFNSSQSAYEDPTPAVEQAGLTTAFKYGEYFFERTYTQNSEPFDGLGPLYIRSSCIACHPGYGHGKRMNRYRADDWGNGYLLVFTDRNDTYLSSYTGMPQTKAVAPFKAPLDETKIEINWLGYVDEWGNQFPDGETYSLIYPEVYIPEDAFYVPLEVGGNPISYGDFVCRLAVDEWARGQHLQPLRGLGGLLDALWRRRRRLLAPRWTHRAGSQGGRQGAGPAHRVGGEDPVGRTLR